MISVPCSARLRPWMIHRERGLLLPLLALVAIADNPQPLTSRRVAEDAGASDRVVSLAAMLQLVRTPHGKDVVSS
jgi:hypothetical protein